MISPAKWVEQLGVGGRLVAFGKAVCVHFALAAGAGGAGAGDAGASDLPRPARAAAKCAPVLCLLLIVLAARADTPRKDRQERRYAALVAAGLALSALGDALLVWAGGLEAGMGAFALAHVAYCAAFGLRPPVWRLALPIYAAAAVYSALMRPSATHLQVLVPVYACVLATMCWRGAARGGGAAAGGLLFALSDSALGYHMFAAPLPHAELIIMSTYYGAQLLIALSALRPPDRSPPPLPPAAPAAPAPAGAGAH